MRHSLHFPKSLTVLQEHFRREHNVTTFDLGRLVRLALEGDLSLQGQGDLTLAPGSLGEEQDLAVEDHQLNDLSMQVEEVKDTSLHLKDEFWDGEDEGKTPSRVPPGSPPAWYHRHGISCAVCGVVYSSKSNCERHIEGAHGMSLDRYAARHGPLRPRQKFRWG